MLRRGLWVLGVSVLAFTGCGDKEEDEVTGEGGHEHARFEMCVKGEVQEVDEHAAEALAKEGAYRGPCDRMENRVSFGDGYVQTFVHLNADGTLRTLGVQVDQAAMDTLPSVPTNDGQTCWDKNGDGTTDAETECNGGHERVLWFPKLKDVPFKWVMFNYQAKGHGPVHVFDRGHFDMHFFIQDFVARNFIRLGPCGVFTNCDDYARAMKDIPAPFWPVGFENQGGVSGRMGNHLADTSEAPFNGLPFTQAFVYGQYDGHLTYFESVVAVDFARSRPDECKPIKAPPAMEISGWYPRKYCTHYRPDRGDYTMTLEDFEFRSAPHAH
jgi:hypothetical protein